MNIKLKSIKDFDIEINVIKSLKNCLKEEKEILENSGFKANEGESFFLRKKLFIGTSKLKGEDIKIAFATASKILKKTKFKTIKVSLIQDKKELAINEIVEGIVLGSYSFDKYKSKKQDSNLSIFIDIENSKKDKKELRAPLKTPA